MSPFRFGEELSGFLEKGRCGPGYLGFIGSVTASVALRLDGRLHHRIGVPLVAAWDASVMGLWIESQKVPFSGNLSQPPKGGAASSGPALGAHWQGALFCCRARSDATHLMPAYAGRIAGAWLNDILPAADPGCYAAKRLGGLADSQSATRQTASLRYGRATFLSPSDAGATMKWSGEVASCSPHLSRAERRDLPAGTRPVAPKLGEGGNGATYPLPGEQFMEGNIETR
jgi:hypothetical protein